MQTFTKKLTVTKNHLDELNHVNNVQYVQWIQDVAKAHWESKVTKSIQDHYFWVVVSHFIEYKNSALLNDVIRMETYVEKSEGIKSTRIVKMFHDTSNKLLLKSETVWCFMDFTTKRPTRITQEVIDLFK